MNTPIPHQPSGMPTLSSQERVRDTMAGILVSVGGAPAARRRVLSLGAHAFLRI